MRKERISLVESMSLPGLYLPKHIVKPWGHETVFAHYRNADGTEGYLGKLLHVQEGHSLSFQYHPDKTETLMLLYGKLRVTFGRDKDNLERRLLNVHTVLHLPPGYLHGIEAIQTSCIAEVSTAFPDNTVRLEDRYGRKTQGKKPLKRAVK